MILLVLWLLIIPFLIGILFNFILPTVRRTVGITFILGYLVSFAVFELVAIPCMLKITYNAFSYCYRYYTILGALLAIAGIVRGIVVLKRDGFKLLSLFPGETHAGAHELLSPRSDPKMLKMNYSLESNIYWGIFFCLLLLQIVMSVVMASFDGDDAYFVVESLLAQQADVMNTILPYTGTSTSLDIRHALAVITMWIAFIAKKSAIHATIVSHSVIPTVVICLVYLVYVEIARILFRRRQEIIPVFMIIISFLMLFGNVSLYTSATFFLTRTWQGKAIVANLCFPMILWIFLWMLEDTGHFHSANPIGTKEESFSKVTPWILLTLINMFSGICTSMGIIFGGGLTALFTLILFAFSKRWQNFLGAFCCVIPSGLYLLLYLSIWGS